MSCTLGQTGPCFFCSSPGECCTVCRQFLCPSHEGFDFQNLVLRGAAAVTTAIAGEGVARSLFSGPPVPSMKKGHPGG